MRSKIQKIIFIIIILILLGFSFYMMGITSDKRHNKTAVIVVTNDNKKVRLTVDYEIDDNIPITVYVKKATKNLIISYYTLDDLKERESEIEAMLYEEIFNELQGANIETHINYVDIEVN